MRPLHRDREVERVRRRLEFDYYPRLQMSLIVLLTGAAGFLASYLLLKLGMSGMALRYLLSICCAYIAFLLLLWMWLRVRDLDVDLPDLSAPGGGRGSDHGLHGGGGSFDGGGASGNYLSSGSDSDIGSIADGSVVEVLGSADEAAIPVAAILLVAGMLLSSLFVVYTAPVLFAELLVDGVLSASLYHRLRGMGPRHWLESALRRTMWPFVLTALLVTLAGWGMSAYAPEAQTFGQVLAH